MIDSELLTQLTCVFIVFNDSSLQNLDLLRRPILCPRLDQAHPLYNPQPTLDSTKDCVFAIQPRRWCQGDEELATVGIGSAVRHTQDARARMLQ